MGRRTLVQALMILFLVMQPGLGFGGTGGGGGGGGCGSSGGGGFASSSTDVASEAYEDYQGNTVTLPASTFSETMGGDAYIAQLLGDASNRIDPRLPGYSYFQGVLQADNHITVAGQVRVIGGLLGADRVDATASLYNGAMITTNAKALTGAGDSLEGGPAGMKTRIRHWEEIPNP